MSSFEWQGPPGRVWIDLDLTSQNNFLSPVVGMRAPLALHRKATPLTPLRLGLSHPTHSSTRSSPSCPVLSVTCESGDRKTPKSIDSVRKEGQGGLRYCSRSGEAAQARGYRRSLSTTYLHFIVVKYEEGPTFIVFITSAVLLLSGASAPI